MKFCSACGHSVVTRIPDGDNRPRYCCDHCGAIHYENPRLIVGTIPVLETKVLLCRRAIEPRHGYWTLPAGFMENGETTAEGAQRETIEEAGAEIELGPVFSMLDVVHVHQVHVFYLARLLNDNFDPGTESLEVRLFEEEDIPWHDIAFRTVTLTLQRFFEDRRAARYGVHTGAISWPPQRSAAMKPANSSPPKL